MTANALVSIVMPTCKPRHFAQALDSVLAQTYTALELVICDDNANGAIEAMLASRLADAPFPIRYHRNASRLGELGNTIKGIGLAQGEYVKFLHDDVLQPDCVAQLVAAMEHSPDAALASSRRRRIDDDSAPLPDILATCFPFAEDVVIDGPELVSFLADHTINLIGEPSCVLCRRADLVALGSELMSLNGKPIYWVGGLAIYVKLLRHGNLVLLSSPLTHLRASGAQCSQADPDQPGSGDWGHEDLRQGICQLGWRRESGDNRLVSVAPLSSHKARVFKSVDLVNALMQSAGTAERVSPPTWLGVRHPTAIQRTLIEARLQAHAGGPRIAVMLIDSNGDAAAVAATQASLTAVACYQNQQTWVVGACAQQVSDHGERGVLISADGLAATLNQLVATQESIDWVLLVDAGTLFTASGLLMLALYILVLPDDCQAVYADEVVALDNAQLGLAMRPTLYLDMLVVEIGGVEKIHIGAQLAAQDACQRLFVVQLRDRIQFRLDRTHALDLDAGFVHVGGVVVADLLVFAGDMVIGGCAFDDVAAMPLGFDGDADEAVETGAIFGNLRGLDPVAAGVTEEVIARHHAAVHAGNIETEIAELWCAGCRLDVRVLGRRCAIAVTRGRGQQRGRHDSDQNGAVQRGHAAQLLKPKQTAQCKWPAVPRPGSSAGSAV